ncbi:MAG: hypothetical protein ACI4U4_05535 [Bacilli bacterium]
MKKITAKVITISSQLLIVGLFLFIVFYGKDNSENIVVNNNNFEKMSDKTSILFKREEKILNSIDDSIVIPLNEENKADEKVNDEIIIEDKEEDNNIVEKTNLFYDKEILRVEVGNLTGYGPDCLGCSGITRSGFNLNDSIYYNDSEFGNVRILAADYSFGKNAIFRVSNVPGMDPFIGIVLDTGSNVGFGKGTLFDLAFATEKDPDIIGLTKNVKFELLREGINW